jgi:hypothetical protein
MKVLFLSDNKLPDFQNDMIFHGGRSVLGNDFVDSNKLWYMYQEEKELYWNERVPNFGKSYGRGFTLYGHFNNSENIDRDNILQKIKSNYFDKIIYASITRCADYLSEVVKYYNKKDIIIVDGEDDQQIRKEFYNIGVYYKRELIYDQTDLLKPIWFSIPKKHIVKEVPNKKLQYATIIPGDLSTYIYDNEHDYFQGYKDAYFGITMKKGGWDCLRHYEIIMNGCVPYFVDLMSCPKQTMTTFPKEMILDMISPSNIESMSEDSYKENVKNLLDYCSNNLTTESLFKYLINE